MFQKIRNVALSAVLGLGALAAAPAAAQADSFYFGITPHGPRAGVIIDEGRSYHRGDRHWDRGGRHWDRGCSVGEALRKADRMGINRAYLRGENRNVIRVGGRSRGHRVTVVFAKAPRCPVIG
jgi:hypothetical protein